MYFVSDVINLFCHPQVLQSQREAEADLQRREEEKQRQQLTLQLNLDHLRKKETQRIERQKARKRGLSNAHEAVQTVEVPIEVFNDKIEIYNPSNGDKIEFDSVMTFNPRPGQSFGSIFHSLQFILDAQSPSEQPGRRNLYVIHLEDCSLTSMSLALIVTTTGLQKVPRDLFFDSCRSDAPL
jgi:hypothetical protein